MLSMTLQTVAGSIYSANGTISTTSYLTRYVSLRGNYRAWKNSYPDVLRLNVYGFDYEVLPNYRALTSSSGAVGGTDTFNRYSTTTTLNQSATTTPGSNNTLTTALDQVPPSIYGITNTTDLTNNGELSSETRFLFRGWRFGGMSTVHDATKSISFTGLSNTYTNNVNMSAYRYLSVTLTAGGVSTGTLVITSMPGARTKQWNLAIGGTGSVNFAIDLCAPPLETASTDNQDSPYPRINPDMATNSTYIGDAQQDGPYWGITRVSNIVFTPASGASWTLNSMNLTRAGYPATTQNFVFSSKNHQVERITKSVVSESGTTTTFYCRRFWQQDSVARTEEESDVHWQVTVGGATGVTTTTILGRTIADLVGDINATDALGVYGGNTIRHNGWTATRTVVQPGGTTCTVSQPPLRDCFLNGDTGYASWVYGGGILCTPASPGTGTTFAYGFDIAPGSHTAQTLFDSINGDFVPDIDDPFDVSTAATDGGGAIFEGLVLVGGNIFRGPAHGIVLNSNTNATPNVGATVNLLRTSTGANRGTGLTGTYGQFETSDPFAQNTVVNYAQYGTANITGTYYSAKRNRNAFRFTIATGSDLSAHNHDYSLMHLYSELSSTFSNRLTLYISPDSGATWNVVDTGISMPSATNGGGHSVRLPLNADSRKIWLTYIQSSGRPAVFSLVTRFSENEGTTWSSVVTLATPAYRPTTCVGINGFEYIFYYTSNSTTTALSIASITRDMDGNVIQTAHTVVTTDAAFDTLAAYVRDTDIFLFYRKYTTNAVVVVKSTDMGNSYT